MLTHRRQALPFRLDTHSCPSRPLPVSCCSERLKHSTVTAGLHGDAHEAMPCPWPLAAPTTGHFADGKMQGCAMVLQGCRPPWCTPGHHRGTVPGSCSPVVSQPSKMALAPYLVAGEAQHHKALGGILGVQLLEPVILRCEATGAYTSSSRTVVQWKRIVGWSGWVDDPTRICP